MRTAFLLIAITAFLGLGLVDISAGNLKQGIASLMLAVLNGLLLS